MINIALEIIFFSNTYIKCIYFFYFSFVICSNFNTYIFLFQVSLEGFFLALIIEEALTGRFVYLFVTFGWKQNCLWTRPSNSWTMCNRLISILRAHIYMPNAYVGFHRRDVLILSDKGAAFLSHTYKHIVGSHRNWLLTGGHNIGHYKFNFDLHFPFLCNAADYSKNLMWTNTMLLIFFV